MEGGREGGRGERREGGRERGKEEGREEEREDNLSQDFGVNKSATLTFALTPPLTWLHSGQSRVDLSWPWNTLTTTLWFHCRYLYQDSSAMSWEGGRKGGREGGRGGGRKGEERMEGGTGKGEGEGRGREGEKRSNRTFCKPCLCRTA